eukprot:TRINITY_DN36869_c0_g1_i2.p1 TRINITY_DN36869_c0_g1~~TRINITY_DN36869_c0_g1_i2.p1  ORF type:complete len:381 (+),score=59.39 TRINITY_DN36869_c0_g1_i2:86-1228(+)
MTASLFARLRSLNFKRPLGALTNSAPSHNGQRNHSWAGLIGTAALTISSSGCVAYKCGSACKADGPTEVAQIKQGKEAHWKNFLDGADGEYHGKFCRWDPFECKILADLHLLRGYYVIDEGRGRFFQQKNKIFFEDGSIREMGPWTITEAACSTSKGIRHPRVEADGNTFITSITENRVTAWVAHNISKSNAVEKPGTLSTQMKGKGYELQGHMVEFIFSAEGAKFSVGYVYNDDGKLQHVTWNREDKRKWPSDYWSYGTEMQTLAPEQVRSAVISLGGEVDRVGKGHQVMIEPEFTQIPIERVDWHGHLKSLLQKNVEVRKLPDGLIVLCPSEIPFGEDWSASFIWTTLDEKVVHSVEIRYLASGDFDCLRHVKFDKSQ